MKKALAPKTKILFTCPETGAVLKGYVRSSGPNGGDLTVLDPRFKEPATKDAVEFSEGGERGTFKLDPEPEPREVKADEAKDAILAEIQAKLNTSEAENAKLKAWIKKNCEDKKAVKDGAKPQESKTPEGK